MIRDFANRATEAVFNGLRSGSLPPDIQRNARKKLRWVDSAGSLQDLRVPPGNRVERLPGSRLGQHSIRINEQWRICFRWEDGDAYDVEIADYH